MVGTATVTAAATVLGASVATGILSEERSPQGQVSFHSAISHSTNNVIVSVVKGPQAIIYHKGVMAGVDVRYSVNVLC